MAVKDRSLNIIDRFTLGYNALIVLLIVVFQSRISHWPLEVLLNSAMIAVVLLSAWVLGDRPALAARVVRNLYPLALFLLMYEQTGRLNHIIFPDFLDSFVIRLEGSIFGFQPAVAFAKRFPQKWLANYLYFAYTTYYLMLPGLGIFLYLRRTRTEFLDYMFSLCGVMYVCYLIYIFLPIRDPINELGFLPEHGSFTRTMAWVYRHFDIQGAAFPSSHVAAALVVMYYTFRCARAALWIVVPLVISLITATVYCRYHYAVDVLAGVATAIILIPLCRTINPALRRNSRPA